MAQNPNVTTAESARPDVLAALLTESCAFDPAPSASLLAALPATPAVFVLYDVHGAPIWLARTQNLRRMLLTRLVEVSEVGASKRANLAEVARSVSWQAVHSAFEARWRYLCAARVLHPRDYRRRIDFGPAYFLNVDWTRPIPEIVVTDRVWIDPGEFAGPWLSRREAAAALDGLRDLFDLCRYPEQVARTPNGKRCAYADMGRCDAPCDGTVAPDAYIGRTQAAWRFICGGCGEWIVAATARMRAVAAEQRFELAAQIKQQLAFAQRWQAEWAGTVRLLADFNCVLTLRVPRRRAWKVFLFRGGTLEAGPLVRASSAADELESWLQAALAAPPTACESSLQMEQTWLVSQFCGSDAAAKAIVVWFDRSAEIDGIVCAVRNAFPVVTTVRAAAEQSEPANPPAAEG